MFWYKVADIFFLVFHLLLIIFNLTGWIWATLRKWHLATILLTLGSWFILGYFYGWGYCPLTDWHWSVLNALGEYGLPASYISYLIERVSGWAPPGQLVDIFTLLFALIALILSLWVNFFHKIRAKRKS